MADDEQDVNAETQPGAPPLAALSISIYPGGSVEANYPEDRALAYELLMNLKLQMDAHFKRGERRVVLAGSVPPQARVIGKG